LRALDIAKNGTGSDVTPRSFALARSWRACAETFLAAITAP
jgi:hypothetical protein